MYEIIVEEEFERLKELFKNNDIQQLEKFCDYWSYEDEYSHDEIDEAIEHFINKTNEYFSINNLPYEAHYGVENVFVKHIKNNF